MSGAEAPFPIPPPKYLKAAYLSAGEGLLRETRATRLYYLPGPIVLLLLIGLAEYVVAAARWGWPGVPGALTGPLAGLPVVAGHSLLTLLADGLALLSLVALLWLVVRYLRWLETVYAVTTNRVIVQRGILSRDFDEIPVTKVRALEIHQSAGERILRYGTIRLTSEGESRIANEAWKGIPRPWEFQKLVDAAAQRYNQPSS